MYTPTKGLLKKQFILDAVCLPRNPDFLYFSETIAVFSDRYNDELGHVALVCRTHTYTQLLQNYIILHL